MEYTPEEKNRLEIDKLSAEVADLRSWVRRWLGAAGGLLGIVTAAVSIIVASYQVSSSAREAQTKSQQADARLAAAERLESERRAREADETLKEISGQTDAKSKELEAKIKELADKENRLKEITEKLVIAEESARALSLVSTKTEPFSKKALDLIVESQGVSQPSEWTGLGITIGIGYDLGVAKKEDFEDDWKRHLAQEQMVRLAEAVGADESRARELAPTFEDIKITREAAVEVFERVTLPGLQARTAQAFPGSEKLPIDAQGALVSLVFERGTSMAGERRQEMRAIRDLVPSGDLRGIAHQLRAMKRLWEGQGLESLVRRYEARAALVESTIK